MLQGRKNSLECGRIDEGKGRSIQVMQGEGCELGWRTDTEAGRESAENRVLESDPAFAIRIVPRPIERQVDGLKPGQLMDARKRTFQFSDGTSSD